MKKDIDWVKTQMVPRYHNYKFNFRHFSEGDFGELNQVEFESESLGGAIDFWEMDWLGILVWDKVNEEEKMNIMLSPEQNEEKEKAFEELQKLLQ